MNQHSAAFSFAGGFWHFFAMGTEQTSIPANKGTVFPAWDRVMSGAENDAASSCGSLHQSGVLLLADWDAGTLCVTSSVRQHVNVSRRYNTRPRNEASADFDKHSGNRLKTGRR